MPPRKRLDTAGFEYIVLRIMIALLQRPEALELQTNNNQAGSSKHVGTLQLLR